MKWFARSADDLHADIELKPNDVIALGRCTETGIADRSISRLHTLLKFQPAKEIVLCKQLGPNSAIVNGVELKKDMKARIGLSSVIELVAGRYRYSIVSGNGLKRAVSCSSTLPSKRAKQSPPSDVSVTSPSRTTATSPSNVSLATSMLSDRLREFILGKIEVEEDGDNNIWSVSKDLIVRNDGLSKGCSKVAVFDMDHTVITTKSGNVFPKSLDDWEIMWPGKVLPKLKECHDSGYRVILMSNQSGVESGKLAVSDLQTKVDRVVKRLGVPVLFMASPRSTATRKPAPGMWFAFLRHFNKNVPVNKDESFYVGDAAGRTPGWNPDQKKKDFSSSDREFAANIGLPFHTPEEYFLGQRVCKQWEYKSFDPRKIDKTLPSIEDGKSITAKGMEMIIMVGYPGSGKSSFCKTHLASYTRVNLDEMKSFTKCASVIEKTLSSGGSVVVDNTCPDPASRKKYSDLAAKYGAPVRCFVMNTTLEHAKHNNRFRHLAFSGEQVPAIVFNTFKSRYREPDREREGFTDVVRVNCVPEFGGTSHEEDSGLGELYNMFLGG